MGNGLFDSYGVDIAALINDNLSPALLPAVLTKLGSVTTSERPAGQLTRPPARGGDTVHSARGLIIDFTPNELANSQILEAGDRKVLLVAESITPRAEPEMGDTVRIEGVTYRVARVLMRDPAAATYTLQVRDL